MDRWFDLGLIVWIVACVCMPTRLSAEHLEPATSDALKDRPVTTGHNEAAKLLLQLDRTSRVAGNIGDIYDNRDRGHSQINLPWFGQLQRIVYDDAERKANQDWALATTVRPAIIVGNSSTSAPPTQGGSNPRVMYTNLRGLELGWAQYVNSNLYVYPEHRDYEPGRFGIAHAGDLYHANTPYVVISRGSSGSDRPFVHAILWTLAAMRPEVKQQLAREHLLMPTVQMVLRRSLEPVTDDESYLSVKAHPTVFDGKQLRPERMVRMAHRISTDRLPPIALMQVITESPSLRGRDYVLDNQPERWGTTPAAISRVYRGPRADYKLVIDLEESHDANDKPLTYHWRLLRGDADLVRIKPLNESSRRVEIHVAFHNEPFTTEDAAGVETRRVDIAAFVHNGDYYSPPSIISIYMPPAQRHTLDADGRVIEIGSGAFASALAEPVSLDQVLKGTGYVNDWPGLIDHMLSDAPAAKLLRSMMSPSRREQLRVVQDKLAAPLEDLRTERAAFDKAHAIWQEAGDDDAFAKSQLQVKRDTAERLVEDARQQLCRLLFAMDTPWGQTIANFFVDALRELRDNPTLYTDHQDTLAPLVEEPGGGGSRALRERLEKLWILRQVDGRWRINAARNGDAPLDQRVTAFERNQLAALHEHLLTTLCGNRLALPEPITDDPRVTRPEIYRDVYNYDEQGTLLAWTRYGQETPKRFNAEGQEVSD
jgi:hypothetical protein